jgi:hypothetical protein
MSELFYELGVRLRAGSTGNGAKPIVLVVLLPGYPGPVELERYYDLAREGMVFFAEVSDKDDRDIIADMVNNRQTGFGRDDIDAHILQLGAVKEGDYALFMQRIQAELHNCPALVDPEVISYLAGYISNFPTGMSDLMKILSGASEFAVQDQAAEITMKHIKMFYSKH